VNPFCSSLPAGFQAQIDWSVWEEDNRSGRPRAAGSQQTSALWRPNIKGAIPGKHWIESAEPLHIKKGAVQELLCC